MNASYRHKRKSGPWRRIFAALFAFSAATAFAGGPGENDTDPTGILRKEHAIIEKIVGVANETAEQIRQSRSVDQERVEKLHDFFTNFADKCHHAKEEEELFQTLKDIDLATTIVELLVK